MPRQMAAKGMLLWLFEVEVLKSLPDGSHVARVLQCTQAMSD